MKNYNNRKSILEQGGLMIEALAMLGLIAVVTPTMYKKSAERTMEVEDINTATTMRTFMNAAEAYMNTNYINIMKDTEGHMQTIGEGEGAQQIGVVDVRPEDLEPYLPYKYAESGGLYNYNAPTIRVVRSGDNLTAFALFPAKVGGEDGVGQERTVRIASLIGANGGYISTADNEANKSARGVGGVWNLDNTHYKAVFGNDDNSKQFSLVTSSSNVVNSSTAAAEADNTKYLQRTKENDNELWRNAMRTDLYMGGANPDRDPDKQNENDFFSIYNVNEMIVGAETDADQNLKVAVRDGDEGKSLSQGNYGLYVAGSGARGNGPGNVYIKDTLLAAGNRFWAGEDTLKYTGTNLEFDGTNFRIGKNQDAQAKDADNYVISGKAEKGNSQLAIMGKVKDAAGDMTGIVDIAEKGDIGHYKPKNDVQKKANVIINTTNKNTHTSDTVEAPKYSADDKAPDFGVDVNGNMVVEGVLAAGQLDVNKIRTSSISVGSENIDDSYKWMDVDKDGVHIHEPNDSYSAAKPGTQAEFKNNLIALRAGDGDNKDDASLSNHKAQIIMNDAGIIEKTADDKDLILANNKVGVQINDNKINIGNKNTVDKAGVTGTDDYLVTYGSGGDVDIRAGNFKISDSGGYNVFTVRGKDNVAGIQDNTANHDGYAYDIAGHGDTVFTNKDDDARFLAMTDEMQYDAAVNIVRGNGEKGSEKSSGVLYVDMDTRNAESYFKSVAGSGNSTEYLVNKVDNTGNQRNLRGGAIYIRKGLVDLVPDTSYVDQGFNSQGLYKQKQYTADNGRGVIRASRFVANNVDVEGNRVTVPDFFNAAGTSGHPNYFSQYNNSQGESRTRYDTYMVNPAYTSVMNDIKLVSRGGARLSDILPVFITKGIYTALNNKAETVYNPTSLEAANMYIDNSGKLNIDRGSNSWDPREPASPIIGVVPAPQCPPGYARMITVTPASIRMSEAGRFKNPVSSNFHGIQMDVDDFTNPTNSDYWEDANGNKHPVDDLGSIQSTDPNAANYIPASKVDDLGQALQLYTAYKSTEQNGKTDVRKLNPSYQEGVHLVGGNEKWDNSSPDGYGGKMEMDVAVNPNASSNKLHDEWQGRLNNHNGSADNVVTRAVGDVYSVKSTEGARGSTNPSIYGNNDIKQTIGIRDTNAVAKVYSQTLSTPDGGGNYNGVANVISSPANTLPLTVHYGVEKDHNLELVPRDYEINQELDISGTRILADRVRNVQFETRPDNNGNSATVYMLSAKNPNSFEPITFQKSTWLKSAAVPLSKGTVGRNQRSTAYATGWAILMGFIYPQHAYANVLQAVGVKNKYQTLPTWEKASKRYAGGYDEQDTKKRYNNSDEYFFWNVFPVEQESLEAFVTTYCYFDQDNQAFGMFKNSADVTTHLPQIDYITTFTSGYTPEGENKKYRQRLNDPSMKYDELW